MADFVMKFKKLTGLTRTLPLFAAANGFTNGSIAGSDHIELRGSRR